MEDTRIALVQMQAKVHQTKENIAKIELFVKKAAEQKVDIICFPELSIHGYYGGQNASVAEDFCSDSVKAISRMACTNGIIILAGMAEKDDSGNIFITQIVAFPDGTLNKYRKTHLGRHEQSFFTPGDELPVFATPKATFGIQICWDLHFPEVTTILSLKGGEIIFAPHASPAIAGERREIWVKYLSARAYDNTIYIAACNLTGYDGVKQQYSGGAIVVDPKGNVIAEAFNGIEEMLVVDLESRLINTIRRQEGKRMRDTFYLKARRPELYSELIRK